MRQRTQPAGFSPAGHFERFLNMARLKSPLLSLAAAGRIGNGPVYSSNRGRAYARDWVKPSDPRTIPQISRRAMFSFLSVSWASMSEPSRALWLPLSVRDNVSPYNAFQSYNLSRWSRNLYPQISPNCPAASGSFYPCGIDFGYAPRSFSCFLFGDAAESIWGCALFFLPTFDTPLSRHHLVSLCPAFRTEEYSQFTFCLFSLPPGTYAFSLDTFRVDGRSSSGTVRHEYFSI